MPVKLEHRLGVRAPAEVVWEILADVGGWPAWTGMYPQASGRIGYGERLALTVALPGQPLAQIEARIHDWGPNEAIHWRWSTWGGLVSTIRYLEIEAMSEEGCIFSNGELFRGPLGVRYAARVAKPLRRAFQDLGEAIRDRAEALWRERQSVAK